jgi:putative PIN family toxin of toxin-antitoxin system
MNVVLDTSVLVSGLCSALGASYRILQLIDQGKLKPLVSVALFIEYEAVLKRPEQRLAHGFSEDDIDEFLGDFARKLIPVEVHFRWRPSLSDPADDFVLEAALNGNAECLVTHNVRDFEKSAVRFGLTILTPGQLLKQMELK